MRFYWVSWFHHGADYRPITFPPNDAILGWWCTGGSAVGHEYSIVAHVMANNRAEAEAAIVQDWPEAKQDEWRFFNDSDHTVPQSRFVISDWSAERYERAAEIASKGGA